MKTKSVLELREVQTVLKASQEFATNQGWVVTIAVTDDGGHLLGLFRMDGAAPITAQIAEAKAKTAALARKETKLIEDMINNGRTAFVTVPGVEGLLEGGVPIVVHDYVIGAVGVSGVKAEQDAEIARVGIAALLTSKS